MNVFLITGGDSHARNNWVDHELIIKRVHPIDRHELDTDTASIGIETVRTFIHYLQLYPSQSPVSAGIIRHGELLTQESQQALLKTLEEPPSHCLLYLSLPSQHMVLPTIVSRCQVVSLKPYQTEPSTTDVQPIDIFNLVNTSIGNQCAYVDSIAMSGQTSREWIHKVILSLSSYLNEKTTDTSTRLSIALILKKLLLAQEQLSRNVNPKLALDEVFCPHLDNRK